MFGFGFGFVYLASDVLAVLSDTWLAGTPHSGTWLLAHMAASTPHSGTWPGHLVRLIDWMEVFFGMIWVAIAIFGSVLTWHLFERW